ncbi:PHP domain-containing protein [Litorivivens sp.]|uniref:PHP domain-containing protein n=1 Tax=Litorivivens sp. TaxID=2020868 RepID=UPI00356612F7
MRVDFHTHTTLSDGSLSPAELIARAVEQGVEVLSLTDHDTLAAYQHLPEDIPLTLIPGIELSCVWSGVTVHVLGLNVDLASVDLQCAVAGQDQARELRAQKIGERLAKQGVPGVYETARAAVGEGRALGRPDFARVLIERGAVSSFNQAFDRFLGAGKVGDVKMHWPELGTVIQWIVASGGVAVLAHPLHYKLTRTKLRRLLVDFMEAGGRGIEVANGRQWSDADIDFLRSLCKSFGLMASVGSDFHAQTPWSEVGCDASLVSNCVPVWSAWQ